MIKKGFKRVGVSKKELDALVLYLKECKEKGFIGNNFYLRYNRDREYFFMYHLEILINRISRTNQKTKQDKTKIRMYYVELKVLLNMFNRVETFNEMLNFERRLCKIVKVK